MSDLELFKRLYTFRELPIKILTEENKKYENSLEVNVKGNSEGKYLEIFPNEGKIHFKGLGGVRNSELDFQENYITLTQTEYLRKDYVYHLYSKKPGEK